MARRLKFSKGEICDMCRKERFDTLSAEFYVGDKISEEFRYEGGVRNKETKFRINQEMVKVILCRKCLLKIKLKRLIGSVVGLAVGYILYGLLYKTSFAFIGGLIFVFSAVIFVISIFSGIKTEGKELLERAGYSAVFTKAKYERMNRQQTY